MLDYVEISSENWSGFGYEVLKPYYLKYDEDEKKSYFSHSYREDIVYVSKSKVQKIFKGLQQLDYMKILEEVSHIGGYDGGRTLIKLSMGMHDLTIAIWAFNDREWFSKVEETAKLVKFYKQIFKLAKDAGFNTEETKLIIDKGFEEQVEFLKWKCKKELYKSQ